MSRLVYLAGPYTHPDKSVEEDRYKIHRAVCAYMMRSENVFSPIVHGHNLLPELSYFSGRDWSVWNKAFLRHAAEVVVIEMPGCEESQGLQFELNMAKELGIPVRKCNLKFYFRDEEWATMGLKNFELVTGMTLRVPTAPEDFPLESSLKVLIDDRLYISQIDECYADFLFCSKPLDGFEYQISFSFDFENQHWGEFSYSRAKANGAEAWYEIEVERMNRTHLAAAKKAYEQLKLRVELNRQDRSLRINDKHLQDGHLANVD